MAVGTATIRFHNRADPWQRERRCVFTFSNSLASSDAEVGCIGGPYGPGRFSSDSAIEQESENSFTFLAIDTLKEHQSQKKDIAKM